MDKEKIKRFLSYLYLKLYLVTSIRYLFNFKII